MDKIEVLDHGFVRLVDHMGAASGSGGGWR
jgi:hypothetical protein